MNVALFCVVTGTGIHPSSSGGIFRMALLPFIGWEASRFPIDDHNKHVGCSKLGLADAASLHFFKHQCPACILKEALEAGHMILRYYQTFTTARAQGQHIKARLAISCRAPPPMRFQSTAKSLAKCAPKYYRIAGSRQVGHSGKKGAGTWI